jgi:hypothetical protein
MGVVIGLMVAHPFTWRVELAKLEYRMLKEATRTDNWGNPLPWRQPTRNTHRK